MSLKNNHTNIVEFPKTVNKEFREQQKNIQTTVTTLETIYTTAKCWENVTILPQDLEVLANFGETLKFSPTVSARLISALANQIIKLNHLEEEYLP